MEMGLYLRSSFTASAFLLRVARWRAVFPSYVHAYSEAKQAATQQTAWDIGKLSTYLGGGGYFDCH